MQLNTLSAVVGYTMPPARPYTFPPDTAAGQRGRGSARLSWHDLRGAMPQRRVRCPALLTHVYAQPDGDEGKDEGGAGAQR